MNRNTISLGFLFLFVCFWFCFCFCFCFCFSFSCCFFFQRVSLFDLANFTGKRRNVHTDLLLLLLLLLFFVFVFCIYTIGLLNVWSLTTYSVEQLQLQVKSETKAVSTFKSGYAWLEMDVERFSKFQFLLINDAFYTILEN